MKKAKKQLKTNTYHHGDLKAACIKQGLAFLSEGNKEFSIRDLAKALNVSHGAPLRHFPSKEALLAAIAEEGFQKFSEALRASHVKADLKKSFVSMGKAYLQFALHHPHHYLVMLGDKIPNHEVYEGLTEAAKQSFMELVNLVAQLIEKYSPNQKDPLKTSYMVWSGVHGLANLAIQGHIKIGVTVDLIKEENLKDLQSYCFEQVEMMSQSYLDYMMSK